MAIVVHAMNGGQAEVSDEQAKVLIESGGWLAHKTQRKAASAAKVHAEASSKLEG